MLVRDLDSRWMIHYLGQKFRESVTREEHVAMYDDALRFVRREFQRFRQDGNSRLALRYFQLLTYFRN